MCAYSQIVVITHVHCAWTDSGVADTKLFLQHRQGSDEADDSRLGREVDWGLEVVHIAPEARHPEEISLDVPILQPIVDCDLGDADRRGRVDGKALVLPGVCIFPVLC